MIFQGRKVVKFSIDDFYLTYEDRQKLSSFNPFLKFRGPPGTHEVELAMEIIEQFKNKEEGIKIPTFDKMLHEGQGDRNGHKVIEYSNNIDVVIFEGWFVGLRHLTEDDTIDFLENEKIAKFSNENLKDWKNWDFLDTLVALKPQEFEYSFKWRTEAERRQGGDEGGMSDDQIQEFVQYFLKSIDPGVFYGNLIKEAIDGENKLGLLIEFAEDRSVINFDFYKN